MDSNKDDDSLVDNIERALVTAQALQRPLVVYLLRMALQEAMQGNSGGCKILRKLKP